MISFLIALVYLAMLCCGMPNALLGSAWPEMHLSIGAGLSQAGTIMLILSATSMITSVGGGFFIKKLGTRKMIIIGILITGAALFGISFSRNFIVVCVLAALQGFGTDFLDVCTNDYAARKLSSRHMNWLHCAYGLGSSISPYIMGFALGFYRSWSLGYQFVGGFLAVCLLLFLFTGKLWKKAEGLLDERRSKEKAEQQKREAVQRMPVSKGKMVCFLLAGTTYGGLENTAALWAASYLVMVKGVSAEAAAALASLFFIGLTAGRLFSGVISVNLSDRIMTRLGQFGFLLGTVIFILPFGGTIVSYVGFLIMGVGCAPIFPSLAHSLPGIFGEEKTSVLMGFFMAFTKGGVALIPFLFGLIAGENATFLLPFYLIAIVVLNIIFHEAIWKRSSGTPHHE